ncbi:MAG: lamin tail domain-containing protein, partial [Candidatus Nealsonbacteria bacterium]|nr:lamin tail domain-containing protein [Candidatus Nealsonbacteria bacterium]
MQSDFSYGRNSGNRLRKPTKPSHSRDVRRWLRRLAFEPLEDRRVLDSTVVFNEVMYNPPGDADGTLEWIELYNQLGVNMDVSEWSLEGGVDFTFAAQTVVPGRGHLLVVPFDPNSQPAELAAFLAEYDVPPSVEIVGPYLGRLDNGGEELRLINNDHRLMNVLDYRDGGDWPVAPDGSGATLAKRDPNTASEPVENWTFSLEIGGTPGAVNFATSFSPIKSEVVVPTNATWKHEASGTDLAAAWREPGYNDDTWNSEPPASPTVLLTEITTGWPRTVEIQNVSEDPVNTTGWRVAVNDTWEFEINDVFPANPEHPSAGQPILWHLPASMAPGDVLYRHDDDHWAENDDPLIDGEHYWGGKFNWFPQGPGWVLVMDDAGTVVDFVVWGYSSETTLTFNVEIDGHTFTIDDVWSGSPLAAAGTRDNSLQRSGSLDRNNAADWAFDEPQSVGTVNPGLDVPFPFQPWELPPGPTTYYYRTEFQYDELPDLSELSLDTLVDDGAVFYLNGNEIYRHNMPAGAIAYDTLASSDLVNPAFEYGIPVSTDGLVPGRNVLAVELHQSSTNDPNNLFATKLTATVWPPAWLAVDKDLAFNEIAPASAGNFWLELVNYGETFINVGQYAIVGSTGHEYVLPAQSLGPGEFL